MSTTRPPTVRDRPRIEERQDDCPECDGRLERDARETYCGECGLLVDGHDLDFANARMTIYDYDADARPRQVATRTRHDGGLTTRIGHPGEAAWTARTDARDFGRLLWQHARTRTNGKHERNRRRAFGEIRRLVAGLELPTVVRRTACRLFRRFHDAGHLQGRAFEVFATALVYAAARIHHYPITMTELATLSRVAEKRIWRGLTAAKHELELSIPPLQAADLVPRIASDIEYAVTPGQRERAVELARLADREPGVDNTPSGLAAAAVYLGANGRTNGEITQSMVAEAAGCTGATLRTGVTELEALEGNR